MTFKGCSGLAPRYIWVLLTPYVPNCNLRSSVKALLAIPQSWLRTKGSKVSSYLFWSFLWFLFQNLNYLSIQSGGNFPLATTSFLMSSDNSHLFFLSFSWPTQTYKKRVTHAHIHVVNLNMNNSKQKCFLFPVLHCSLELWTRSCVSIREN